ncbi:hypothetical protein [Gloeothece verrucosa]|uniref:Uncharacterized protein n=1 Tax=Gloeothece verrucosa (strain PCC 7822) TaxID=497965 RepID=E0UCV0_GLOV7|nr:hypothetical protein [Gloeothece verrucosa]ADN16415.1 hypothetical protein Cyan7822_4505 [Gloeothece verrucosa PCC 7822]
MTTIVQTKIAMYPVYLPQVSGSPSTWINLANVLTVEYNPEKEDEMLIVTFITGKFKAYRGEQAKEIIKALKEAQAKYC